MKSAVQNKIDSLKSLARLDTSEDSESKSNVRSNKDNLSRAIRTKRDADIFMNELKTAISLSKK